VVAIPLVLLFPVIGTILKLRRLPKIEEEKQEVKEEKQQKNWFWNDLGKPRN
jgi:hypothetical protein